MVNDGRATSETSFASLFRFLEVDSDLVFVDDRGGASIEYSAQASRTLLGEFLEEGMLLFGIPSFAARQGRITIGATSSEVQFLVAGQLAGVMDYEVGGTGAELRVRTDFGSGGFPIDRWSCP